jgi:cysteine synthase A
LANIPKAERLTAKIFVKLESANPTGSLKDRIYLEMISKAIESGDLRPGMEILEASTGNAGISCSYIGSLAGYTVNIVMPEGMSAERKKLIRAFGGRIIETQGGESDVDLCLDKVAAMQKESPGKYWFPNQFANPNNPAAHYKTTGPEILRQRNGNIDCFLASVGTGGILTGVGRFLRSKSPSVRLYAVEPAEAPVLSKHEWGSHRIEGIGDGFVPDNLDVDLLTGVVVVSSDDSVKMARRLAKEEGIFCGISSGCNVAAAIKVARAHPELRNIVTVINDSVDRYLSTELFGERKVIQVPERDHRRLNESLDRLSTIKLEVLE